MGATAFTLTELVTFDLALSFGVPNSFSFEKAYERAAD